MNNILEVEESINKNFAAMLGVGCQVKDHICKDFFVCYPPKLSPEAKEVFLKVAELIADDPIGPKGMGLTIENLNNAPLWREHTIFGYSSNNLIVAGHKRVEKALVSRPGNPDTPKAAIPEKLPKINLKRKPLFTPLSQRDQAVQKAFELHSLSETVEFVLRVTRFKEV
jgi:hypothetical protein